ncbi:hypothetical protein ACFWHR_12500 [Leucobacter sp. NPDC058333]|uniref:PH-like domain-containing protein n=1 Tax=Leucobacter sp. NPDC058333 TaxID=3346450 RepID=UPI0036617E65
MTRGVFALVMIALAALVLLGMWLGWRSRARRHSGFAEHGDALIGAVVAGFERVSYVSTTPIGAPLERLSIPGLRFKGFADLTIRTDGATIEVTGEPAVHLPVARLIGAGSASRRVGKAVERDGLSLLQWRAADGSEIESSFRFPSPAEQLRFEDALTQILPAATPDHQTHFTSHTTQEDA